MKYNISIECGEEVKVLLNIGLKNLTKFCCLLGILLLSTQTHAAVVTMDANGTAFQGNLRAGDPTNNVGILFFHGRGGNMNGNFVKHVGKTMATSGYTNFSLANPEPSTGTSWASYVNEEDLVGAQVIARLDTALTEMANRGIEHVVFAGISLGARLMTAAVAAWDQGLFSPTSNINLVGLIGASMYPETGAPIIARTPSNPTSISDINFYDVEKNMTLINTVPVLDIYGSNDPRAINFAPARRAAYSGSPSEYVQTEITCPADNGTYYAWLGGNNYVPYYDHTSSDPYNRCHQLRDGHLADGSGGYYKALVLRETLTAPVETSILAFMDKQVLPQTQFVPEASSLFLLLAGLPLLFVGFRNRNN